MEGHAAPQAGTPASMRALNQRLVLNRLRDHGEATRPQIAVRHRPLQTDCGTSTSGSGAAWPGARDRPERGPPRQGRGRLPHRSGRGPHRRRRRRPAGGSRRGRGPRRAPSSPASNRRTAAARGPCWCAPSAESVERAVAEAGLAAGRHRGHGRSGRRASRTRRRARCTGRRICPAGNAAACCTNCVDAAGVERLDGDRRERRQPVRGR